MKPPLFSKKRRKTMEKQRIPPTAAKTEAQSMPRRPYAPPKATFVPLKLEERLLGCLKPDPQNPVCIVPVFAS